MSYCYKCNKKFALLNLDRRRCKECELHFCFNCMPTMFGSYCKICKILNTRPPDINSILKLKGRQIKRYLSKRRVQTESCIEKEDLVKCFLKYVTIEPTIKNNLLYVKFNIPQANRYSSTPNLVGTSRETNETTFPQTPPPRMPYSSQNNPSGSRDINPPDQFQAPDVEQGSHTETSADRTNTSAFQDQATQETSAANAEDNLNAGPMKLSDILEAKDIQSLSIKQLKELLMINRVDYKGCVEKDELRGKVTQLWTAAKEKPDVSNLPVDELCKICMDAPLNSVLLECGHIVSCIDCGKQLAECPVCRQYVVRVVHTFKA